MYVVSKMQAETITYAKRTKRTQDRTGDTLRTHLSTLLTGPESPTNTAEIHKTQNDLQTLKEEIIHNRLCKRARDDRN